MTRWSYDPYGRLSAITDGAANRLQFTLSNEGLLRTFTDANGNAYRYDYKRGLPYALTFPNGTSEYTQLDALGRIVREINHRGQAVEYAYDKLGRVIRQSYPGGFTEWQYDGSGRMTKASNAHSACEIRYDRFGETAEIRDARNRTTRFEYNDKGQRTALIDPEGRRTVYEYDRRGSLSRITGPAGESYRYEYDPAGRLARISDPVAVGEAEAEYDRFLAWDEFPVSAVSPLGRWTVALFIDERFAGSKEFELRSAAGGDAENLVDVNERTLQVIYSL